MNRHIATVIVAPLTSQGSQYPTRAPCRVGGRDGLVVLDQIRTVDQARLVRRVATLDAETASSVLTALQEMFAP